MSAQHGEASAKSAIIAGALLAQVLLSALLPHAAQAGVIPRSEIEVYEATNATATTTIPIIIATTPTTEALVPDTSVASDKTPKIAPPDGASKNESDSLTPRTKLQPQATVVSLRQGPGGSGGGGSLLLNRVEMEPLSNENGQLHPKDGLQGGPESGEDTMRVLSHDSGSDNSMIGKLQAVGLSNHVNDGLEALSVEHLALDKGVEKDERAKEEMTTETALAEVESVAVATKAPPTTTTLSSVSVGNRHSMLRSEEIRGNYAEKELEVTTIEPLAIELLAVTQPRTASTTAAAILATMSAHKNIITDQASTETLVSVAEKRGKFISDNSTNAQQLNLPEAAEVWTLIGMKPAPTPMTRLQQEASVAGSTEATSTNSEKNLLDWTKIMMNAQLETQRKEPVAREVFENRTEIMTNATLDTTDGFVDAITPETIEDHRLEPLKNAENSIERETATTTMARPADETEPKEEIGAKGPAILSTDGSDNNNNTDNGTIEKASEAAKTESTAASSSDRVREESAATIATMTTTTETALPENHSATGSTTTATTTTPPTPTAAAAANASAEVILNVDSTTPLKRLLSVASSETSTLSTRLAKTNTTTQYNNSARDEDVKGETVKGDNDGEGENNNIRPDAATAVFTAITTAEIPTTPPRTVLATTEVGQIGNEVDLDLLVETKATKSQYVDTTERRDEEGTVAKEEASEGFITRVENETSTTTPTPTSFVNDLLITTTTTTTETATTSIVPIITTTTTAAAATSSELTPVQASNAPTTGSVPVEVVQTTTKATTTTLTAASTVGDADGGGAKPVDTESSIETNVIDPLERKATTVSTIATATAPIATKPKQEEAENVKDTSNALGVDDDEEVALHVYTLLPQTTTLHTTTTTMGTLTPTTTTTKIPNRKTMTTVEPPLINLLGDSTITTTTTVNPTSIESKIEELNKVIATTVSPPQSTSSLDSALPYSTASIVPLVAYSSPTYSPAVAPPKTTTTMLPPSIVHASIGRGGGAMPVMPTTSSDNTPSMASGNLRPNSIDPPETDVNVIIAITVSVIGVIALILLVAFLYLIRKRQKQMSYGQRCRPVSLDAYSLDNVSVLGSVRRKGAARASKRSYGNIAFDDPSLRHNVLTATELAKFVERRSSIFEEFRDIPQIIARANEVPPGCEDKNRYANVIPLPETRVILQQQNDNEKSEYINANYVRGPKDAPNYYIACQAPLESLVTDFWRMIWEQQSRVIIQATDLIENGIEKCAEYLPPSVTLDNHTTYGDFQVTLKHREVKDKYAISTLVLKNTLADVSRELTHYWYKWPESGVPAEEAPIIAMLLEARSSLKSYSIEEANELKEKSSTLTLRVDGGSAESPTSSMEKKNANGSAVEINGSIASDKLRTAAKSQGPLTIHCSPGTGRTGTVIACDMAIRSLETPKRSVDIPQIVYYVRRGRASAVQTKEQYEFIYKVSLMYATKITNPTQEN